MKKITTEVFIEKAKLKHNDNYCYSKVIYKNSQTKILLKCKRGHEFLVRPDNHLNRGDGCRLCKKIEMNKGVSKFKNELFLLYSDLYDYSLVEYDGVYNKVKIICKEHGVFSKTPNQLLKGRGCNKCCINGHLDTNEFIRRANEVHKNRYDYSKSKYFNSRCKITIICKKHGEFKQLCNNHLRGHGCNKCNRSNGEIIIENLLDSKEIIYKTEFTFEDLRYKYPLRFDFAIIDSNKCIKYLIEFNGKQHYNYYPRFHRSEIEFEDSMLRDEMKIKYCKDNNIKLYIISYKDDLYESIEKIIKENEQENEQENRV